MLNTLLFLISGGRTIVFTETKDHASELAGVLPGARPLHGDIQQSQREVTYISYYRLHLFLPSTTNLDGSVSCFWM